jgi:colanic acid biosynthesis glycosyl transferase WcaI
MRILLHDYSGHPFQAQLGRALAGRGHEVLHVSCSSYRTGKGALARSDADPPTFSTHQIDLGRPFERYSLGSRLRHEIGYGAAFTERADAYRPDVVLSCNDPLVAKARAARWCARSETPWVFWLQDLYSVAMGKYIRSQLGPAGGLGAKGLQALERRLLREAAAVVAITEDFNPVLRRWRIPPEKCQVIENWAPLEEINPGAKANAWSREQKLDDRFVFLYTGTLGLKHDPQLLVTLAERTQARGGVSVVVISEGRGADWLRAEAARRGLSNLMVLPYQPYERLSDVMASADVLVVLLEHDAGVYSVPSKILTYLCARRPILSAMPASNLGARTIERARAGIVVAPGDAGGFIAAAETMLEDWELAGEYADHGRNYAEKAFDIERIAASFETILAEAVGSSSSSPSTTMS